MGEPNDRFEREADRVADQVTRMADTEMAHTGMAAISAPVVPHIQRLCAECEEDLVQAKQAQRQASGVRPQLEQHIRMLHDNGQPLPVLVRGYFEPRFKCDFSSVRIHTGTQASQAAREFNARAFTTGRNIFLGSGEYNPATARGRHLLAHELTHVVQQGSAEPRGMVRPAGERKGSVPSLQCQTEDETIEPAFSAVGSEDDLQSEPYTSNARLQRAFDNNPALRVGESGEAVQLVQEGLVRDGFLMPRSTKPTGELDGAFGQETFSSVRAFQRKHGLDADGIIGHQTMGKLDELAVQPPELQCTSTESALADTRALFPGGVCLPLQLRSRGVTVDGDIGLIKGTFETMCPPPVNFIIAGNKILADKCPGTFAGSHKHGCECLCTAISQGKFTIKVVTNVTDDAKSKRLHKIPPGRSSTLVNLIFPEPGPSMDPNTNIITLWHPSVTNFSVGAFNSSGNPLPEEFLRVLAHELCGHGVENTGDAEKGFREIHDATIEIENKIAGETQLPARGKFANKHQGESFHQKTGDPNSIFRLGVERPGEDAFCAAADAKDEGKCWHHEPV
jgi:peptidoglycan hydrolase-like protein with peptidoglycan-binding domain